MISCPRCTGNGLILAEHREEKAAQFAFDCGCTNRWQNLPRWSNEISKIYISLLDKDYPTFRNRKSKELLGALTQCFENKEFDSPQFEKLLTDLGRDFVEERFREFKRLQKKDGEEDFK